MQPIRIDEQGVVYLRPMLGVHRKEIEKLLADLGQDFCIDGTNACLEYSRNYMRSEVLPRLEEMNSQAVAHINQMSYHLTQVQDFLAMQVQEVWGNVVLRCDEGAELDIVSLMKLHPVLQKELLMEVVSIVAGKRKDLVATHIEAVQSLCEKQSGKEVHLPSQVVAKRSFERLILQKGSKTECDEKRCEHIESESDSKEIQVTADTLEAIYKSCKTHEVTLGEAGERIRIRVLDYDANAMGILKKTYTKWLDYDKIRQGFCIITRRQGDYFIGDVQGHRKKLQNYFVEEKISAKQRESMWLLAKDSYVLWLVGGRISEDVKVTELTNRVVELEYIGG